MGEPIGPGDMVERLADAFPGKSPPGTIALVVGVHNDNPQPCEDCGRAGPSLKLGGWPNDICPEHWRPISRRADFEIILAQLKTPVPVPEHETA